MGAEPGRQQQCECWERGLYAGWSVTRWALSAGTADLLFPSSPGLGMAEPLCPAVLPPRQGLEEDLGP